MYLSPYVEKPFNSKVIKSFVPFVQKVNLTIVCCSSSTTSLIPRDWGDWDIFKKNSHQTKRKEFGDWNVENLYDRIHSPRNQIELILSNKMCFNILFLFRATASSSASIYLKT